MFSRDSIIVRNIKYISPKVKKIRKYTLIASVIIAAGFLLFTLGYYYHLSSNLPPLNSIMDYRPKSITEVYSGNGRLIGEFYTERRKVIPLNKVPKRLVQAFVAAEDGRFYEHEGLDFFSIFRALIKNILVGEVVQGGSTITQQVAKSLLSSERTLKRKTREAILSYRIENKLTKDNIIFLYLNEIYLGHGAYGVQAAAENYFRKDVSELNLAEMATLAGLPQAPSAYSPYVNPELAKQRMFYVLSRMVEEGFINIVEATDAMNSEITVYPIADINNSAAPYFTEHVRQYLEKTYGSRILYSEGLKVFTTLDLAMQKKAQAALKKGLFDHDKRQGFRGVVKHLEFNDMKTFMAPPKDKSSSPMEIKEGEVYEAVVISVKRKDKSTTISLKGGIKGEILFKEMRWARTPNPEVNYYEAYIKHPSEAFQVGDIIRVKVIDVKGKKGVPLFSLHQEPIAQAALLAIDPSDGSIKVMEGGYDFRINRFNRAVQARRQPGSSFKPVIYSAALDKGMTPKTKIVDSPYVYVDSQRNFVWRPQNYDGRFLGPISLKKALAQSRNIVSIRLAKKLGISKVIDYARKLGIRSDLSKNLSLSLGSSGLSLLEITSAYAVFASGGKRHEPLFIREIRDRDGKVLKNNINAYFDKVNPYERKKEEKTEDDVPREEEKKNDVPLGYAIPPQTAYTMTMLLQGVVQEGTAKKAKVLKRPVAGKTGTTDENRDAWFIGFTPDLVAGVWVGFDDRRPLGRRETGSRAALPIFIDFMQEVYQEQPPEEFPLPEKE
ncbi:MAG: PBP1A family penicillin-binding protein [Deltaproteobacteria bacterium]|nr:PBP1A family penicillin-binding protein [Deltaproteobacteria bacterium]